MLRKLLVLLGLLLTIITGSCRDDFEYRSSADTLRFSKDTVYLDTVFNGLSSSTYSLKVYNTSNTDMRIPEVHLEAGESSSFRLNVNGSAGKLFYDVEIPARDSIYIFIESTLDFDDPPSATFLATDAIVFTDGLSRELVHLVTLVQDAVFLYPDKNNGIVETIPIGLDASGDEIRVEGFELTDNEIIFTSNKPYVIYGYAAVPSGKTLEIQAGSRVHFHESSGLIIRNGASLQIDGTLSNDPETMENEVIFEGDRLEPGFSEIPGQWGTIWLAEGSINNHIKYLTVRNATIGMLVEGDPALSSPKLTMEGCTFSNSSFINILARNTSVIARNTIVGSSGQASVYLTQGGNYEFTHCTIANYWNTGLRSFPALLIDNFSISENGNTEAFPLVRSSFNNCIITGSASVEFLLNSHPEADFNFSFNHSLLQFNTTNTTLLNDPVYDFNNPLLYRNNSFNGDPGFFNSNSETFSLTASSAAIGIGDPVYGSEILEDIAGHLRDTSPDAGAFEYTDN